MISSKEPHNRLTDCLVNIKWGKEQFSGVEVDTNEEVLVFKSQIYALTNVPVDKQKVMIKGKILKDDDDLKKAGLTSGMTIMMMGTAEGKELKEPEKPVKFFEDMTATEKARALNQALAIVAPPGLENLGNTCYMASTLQVLKRVNELKAALVSLKKSNPQIQQGDTDTRLAAAGGQLMASLDTVTPSIKPFQFVQALRQSYPMYDETDDHGHHKQQDADECFQSILQSWRRPLQTSTGDDLIGNLFEIELESELKCVEAPDEPVTSQSEKVLRLSCHIDNNNNPINMLWEGIKISLEGDIEKRSQTLGRDAVYHKTSRINRLPQYICVQFVRFYWKQQSNSSGTDAGKAKILRSVSFPRTLDVWEFCTDELKKSLDLGREFETKQREEEDNKNLTNKDQDVEMKDESKEESKDDKPKLVGVAAKLAFKQDQIKLEDSKLYRPHGQGLDTGNYQLIGVVTHKGRSADGGHYIGWVHASGDDWLRCDDDIVTVVKTEDILALRGGGDWHTAYLCLYRKVEVTKNLL